MANIVVTDEVSHCERSSGLKDDAASNILLMSVTADVSQDDMFPSNADAP